MKEHLWPGEMIACNWIDVFCLGTVQYIKSWESLACNWIDVLCLGTVQYIKSWESLGFFLLETLTSADDFQADVEECAVVEHIIIVAMLRVRSADGHSDEDWRYLGNEYRWRN